MYSTVDYTLVNHSAMTTKNNSEISSNGIDPMQLTQNLIASVGIITNLIVVVVFLKDRKLRRKIPNMFIINQVSYLAFFCKTDSI